MDDDYGLKKLMGVFDGFALTENLGNNVFIKTLWEQFCNYGEFHKTIMRLFSIHYAIR